MCLLQITAHGKVVSLSQLRVLLYPPIMVEVWSKVWGNYNTSLNSLPLLILC